MAITLDIHVHTRRHSTCSIIAPEKLIPAAVKAGLDGLVITEHHYQWTAEELATLLKEADAPGFVLLSAMEYTSEAGDVLIYGLSPEAVAALPLWQPPADIVAQAHSLGGVCVAAHPTRAGLGFDEGLLISPFEAIETRSINLEAHEQQLAQRLAENLKLPAVSASDAHRLADVGRYALEFDAPVRTMADLCDALRSGWFQAGVLRRSLRELMQLDNTGEKQVQEAQEKPSARQEVRREAIELAKMVLLFLVLFWGIKTFVVEGYEVQGDSMIPTLTDRERILVFKLPQSLRNVPLLNHIAAFGEGDIVVFDSGDKANKRYIKRVIARGPQKRLANTASADQHDASHPSPWDTVVKYVEGTVYVNNHQVQEDYLVPAERQSLDTDEAVLGPGQCYVLGDHRSVSRDSRSFGPVEGEQVIGRAVLRFWPLSKFGLL